MVLQMSEAAGRILTWVFLGYYKPHPFSPSHSDSQWSSHAEPPVIPVRYDQNRPPEKQHAMLVELDVYPGLSFSHWRNDRLMGDFSAVMYFFGDEDLWSECSHSSYSFNAIPLRLWVVGGASSLAPCS